MAIEHLVSIDLGFDCSSETERPWDVADDAIDRINNFLSSSAPGGVSTQRFSSEENSLYVNISIPVDDIDAAKALETILDNSLPGFPPLLNNLRRFVYISKEVGEPVEPVEP